MELKIKISDNIYEEIKNDNSISFDELHGLFDAIRNGTPTTVSKSEIDELECILNKEEADIFNSLSNEQKEVVCKLLDNAIRNGNPIEEVVSNGDCISRQAVLWYINRILNHGMGKKKSFEFIHKYVEKLPSITPQQRSEAYKIVFDDLTREDNCTLFRGIYDAKNGNASYMHGISTVMEYIASQVSEQIHDNFEDTFFSNMIRSKERAKNECR